MTRKNRDFAAGLAGAIDAPDDASMRSGRLGMGVLAGRGNRLAELASGSLVNRTVELVDPARCRMWTGHNRDYAALDEQRCHDLIESLKGQGRQEVPALVRRVRDDPAHDFEVISGARRHWSISWLRAHNYPEFRFLVEVRDLTDEEAFRLSDIENRAREDISDYERARDYLRALDAYYGGKQSAMAERMKVTPSWLSRYLDLVRLSPAILGAFASPHDLGIKHVTQIKPLLKPADRAERVEAMAIELRERRGAGEGPAPSPAEVVRILTAAANAPKKSGSPARRDAPRKSGLPTFDSVDGKPMLRVERAAKRGVTLTLLPHSGASRREVEAALAEILDTHWREAKG